jgi:hypothetical protein
VVITESVGNTPMSLHKYFVSTQGRVAPANRMGLLSRLILSMHKLHEIGVSHNDMHWNNIVVRFHDQPISLQYPFHGRMLEYYDITASPVLFDWDFSEIADNSVFGSNPFLGAYMDRGSRFSPARDLLEFVQNWHNTEDENFYALVTKKICSRYMGMLRHESSNPKSKFANRLFFLFQPGWFNKNEFFDAFIDRNKFVEAMVFVMREF